MKPAYVEYKDLKDLCASFVLKFDARSVRVYVWKNVRGLRRNTYYKPDTQLGAYVYYPYRKKRSGLFGEIHLVKWMIGAGYVAHEIDHFTTDWLLDHKLKGVESVIALNEPKAQLTGDFTKAFWNAWLEIERKNGKR
jgi:hypothetical protein